MAEGGSHTEFRDVELGAVVCYASPMSQIEQFNLVSPEEIWRESLLAKSKDVLPWEVWENLNKCGKETLYRTCQSCGNWENFSYRCSLKFCPVCNWRIARSRAELIKAWSHRVTQPKHVVLTCRNFPLLTRKKIRWFLKQFAKIRKTSIFKQCRGGCISVELTNESRGWHLHAHILCDARWIDAGDLAVRWGKLMHQEFAIVKVLDVHGQSYAHEVCKYVVKGSELVSWQPDMINQFIQAVSGVRMFTTWGSLFKIRRQIKNELESQKPEPKMCKCGCAEWRYETEQQVILGEIRQKQRRRA